jgi:PAS domain S-box-containing protein
MNESNPETLAQLQRANWALQAEVADLRRTEAGLRASEQLYRITIENILDPVFITDDDGRFTFVCANVLPILGYTVEEVQAMGSISALLGERSFALGELEARGELHNIERPMVDKAGRGRIYLVTVKRVHIQGGTVLYTCHDITGRKHAEAALQRAHDELGARVADRTRELSVLYKVAAAASQPRDLTQVLSVSLEMVLEAVKSGAGIIQLVGENGSASPLDGGGDHALRVAVHRGLPPEIIPALGLARADGGPNGWVVTHSRVLALSDASHDVRFPALRALGRRAYVAAPLRASGQIVGVLGVVGEPGQPPFSGEEISLITSVADQLGLAVESARLRAQLERAAVLEERERLARDLHDSVTQLLYTVNLCAVSAQRALVSGNHGVLAQSLEQLGDAARQALRELRLMLYELRPALLAEEGLVGALQRRLDAVERRVGVDARLEVSGEIRLPKQVEQELYHVALEALNNALKHAKATTVAVRVEVGQGYVQVRVADDGAGFDLSVRRSAPGMGLSIMEERMRALSGTLAIESAPGEGTRIEARVPMQCLGAEAGHKEIP